MSWWELYRKLKRQAEKEDEKNAKMLTAQLSEITAIKDEDVTRIDRNMKHIDRKRKKPALPVSGWRKGPPYNPFKMITPTHSLNHKPRQIAQAPPGFVEEAKRKMLAPGQLSARLQNTATASNNRPLSNASNPPRPRPAHSDAPQGIHPVSPNPGRNHSPSSLSEREARLRALTSGRAEDARRSRPVTTNIRQEMSKTRGNDDLNSEDEPASPVRPASPNRTRASGSKTEEAQLSPPPKRPKRDPVQKQNESDTESTKRRRLTRPETPKAQSYSSQSQFTATQHASKNEEGSLRVKKDSGRNGVNSSNKTTPKAREPSPRTVRQRSRPSPDPLLVRKRRLV